MKILRVTVTNPPAGNRSRWVRELLELAVSRQLSPVLYPVTKTESFTVTVHQALYEQLEELAQLHNRPIGELVAGLVEAAQSNEAGESQGKAARKSLGLVGTPGSERVRPLLTPLLRDGYAAVEAGKIVFAEAATGTGKGNVIASLAATAASKGHTVVVAAPLAVTWQLIDALTDIPEAAQAGVKLLLGRPNFISPERLGEWARDTGCQAVAEWLDAGAPPITPRLVKTSSVLQDSLAYLLEDALSLAPDLPVDYCMLDVEDDPDDCPAEALYLSQRDHGGGAAIIVCSHYMLAASCRTRQIRGELNEEHDDKAGSGTLPGYIDTLIVDEAHLLEGAFAAVNAHTLRLRPLMRAIEQDVTRGKRAALDALQQLYSHLQTGQVAKSGAGGSNLDDLPGVTPLLKQVQDALSAIKPNSLPSNTRLKLRVALAATRDALSGYSRVRVDLSPIKGYPMLLSGRANLNKSFAALWDSCAGAFLTSATLYTDNTNGTLTRWKLEVPKERVLYLPAVHPAWITAPVSLMGEVAVEQVPDDSDLWAEQTANAVAHVAGQARGGTLVLCTSLQNLQQLAVLLRRHGDITNRIIAQSTGQNASMCATLFRSMADAKLRPVWLGVGAAWTGIDLTDHSVKPADDELLTDLVVTRLPLGLNRSITHDRRVQIAGFRIISQEALWTFRQGLGRLVRREGVRDRKLWVLDARLNSGEPWVKPFVRLLQNYRKQT